MSELALLDPRSRQRSIHLPRSWPQALDEWAAWCRAGDLAPRTIYTWRSYLLRFATSGPTSPDAQKYFPKIIMAGKPATCTVCKPYDVTASDCARFLANPAWSAETRKSARAALRSFYRFAVDTGRMEQDPTARLPRIRVPAGQPRPVTETALHQALRDADDRTRLILYLGALAGLRAAEIATLRWADVVLETSTSDLQGFEPPSKPSRPQGGRLHITGKGRRQRIVPVHPVLAEA